MTRNGFQVGGVDVHGKPFRVQVIAGSPRRFAVESGVLVTSRFCHIIAMNFWNGMRKRITVT